MSEFAEKVKLECCVEMIKNGILFQMINTETNVNKAKGSLPESLLQKAKKDAMSELISEFKAYFTNDGKKLFVQALQKAVDDFKILPKDMFTE